MKAKLLQARSPAPAVIYSHEIAAGTVLALMASEREKALIRVFLRGFNKKYRASYQVLEWPDCEEHGKRSRPAKAVDAIAVDSTGRRVSIEHTVVEAFEGAARNDSVFEPIRSALKKPSAVVPGYHIIVLMRADSLEGLRADVRRKLGEEFGNWFGSVKILLRDGRSKRRPNLCGRRLTVTIVKRRIRGFPGQVTLHRSHPSGLPQFLARLRKALDDKLPKLSASKADRRILLLEAQDFDTPSFWHVARALRSLEKPCVLFQVNRVWWADMRHVLIDGSNQTGFYEVWPEGRDIESFYQRINRREMKTLRA